jgi:hypothetical protein
MSFIINTLYWYKSKNRILQIAARSFSLAAIVVSIYLLGYCLSAGGWAIGNNWSHSSRSQQFIYIAYWFWTLLSNAMNFCVIGRIKNNIDTEE